MRRITTTESNQRVRERYKQESSWGRIIQHIEGSATFAVISSHMQDFSENANEWRHEQLRDDIREMGYGYVEMDSGYTYKATQGGEAQALEQAFFIPEITKDEALSLGQKYDQETIIWKDQSQFAVIFSTTGAVDMDFQMERSSNGQITFDPETLKMAFSRLRKGSANQRGQSFAFRAESVLESFTVRAIAVPTRGEAYRAQKTGKLPQAKAISLNEYLKGRA